MKVAINGLRSTHEAQEDAEIIRLFLDEAPIGARFEAEYQIAAKEIQARQARSIRVFPFVHFIACEGCLNDPTSPAALINKTMSDLAWDLDSGFAREFTGYACDYYSRFLLAPERPVNCCGGARLFPRFSPMAPAE